MIRGRFPDDDSDNNPHDLEGGTSDLEYEPLDINSRIHLSTHLNIGQHAFSPMQGAPIPSIWILLVLLSGSFGANITPEDRDNTIDNHISNLASLIDKFSALYLTSLDQKLSTITNSLNLVDSNVRNLQEKSGTWNIFLHHVQAWTDTMKSIDHKVNLVKLAQDETDAFESKLNSMEFAINHVLTKVDTLSEKNRATDSAIVNKVNEIYKIVQNRERDYDADKKELTVKLTAIMRHILNIENGNAREAHIRPKVSRDTHPDAEFYNEVLENVERKIDKVLKELSSANGLPQVLAKQRENSEIIAGMKESIQSIDERTLRLYDAEAQHSSKLLSCCRHSSDELATFTTSSDLLLKRLEKLMGDVQNQVRQLLENSKDKSEGSVNPDKPDGTEEASGVEKSKKPDDPEAKPKDTNASNSDSEKEREKDTGQEEASGEGESTEDEHDENVEEISREIKEKPEKTGCHEIEERVDGVYRFKNGSDSELRNFYERYCTFPTEGLGWTVIQRRGPYEIQENFNRSWNDYKYGFGDLHRDFWYGNEFIHRLVYKDIHELRIEMEDFEGVQVWAEYSVFQVEPEKYNYKLMIGGFRGSVTDSMLYHNGMEFSTYDRRNDRTVDECCSCATGYGSGWWFDNCSEANLNGVYRDIPRDHNYIGIVWENWHGDYSLKKTRMMIRAKNIWSEEEPGVDDDVFPEMPPEDP